METQKTVTFLDEIVEPSIPSAEIARQNTTDRSIILQKNDWAILAGLAKQIDIKSAEGHLSLMDELLTYMVVTLRRNKKRSECEVHATKVRIQETLEKMGYTVTYPYAEEPERDTVILLSWAVKENVTQ